MAVADALSQSQKNDKPSEYLGIDPLPQLRQRGMDLPVVFLAGDALARREELAAV